jgi:hypothetical protein
VRIEDVLDIISSLIDKSLLRQIETADGEPRFTMLETIREFGRECLAQSGEQETLQRRHAEFFLALAEEAEPHLFRAEQTEWLNRLSADHDNLRAALEWSLSQKDEGGRMNDESGEPAVLHPSEVGLRLAGALWYFWAIRGHFSEGREWVEDALSTSAMTARAKTLNGAIMMTYFQSDYARMSALAEESVQLCRKIGDEKNLAFALSISGVAAILQGDAEKSRAFNEEGLALARKIGDQWRTAFALNCTAIMNTLLGDTSRTTWDESRALFRSVGDQYWGTYPLIGAGFMAQAQNDFDDSAAMFAESLHNARELGNTRGIALSLAGLAGARTAQGNPADGAKLLGASEALREVIRSPILAVYRSVYEGNVAATRKALSEATFAAAWAEGRRMTMEEAVAYALSS